MITAKEILSDKNNLEKAIQFLLYKEYRKGFELDEDNEYYVREPSMSFEKWLISILEES